MKGHFLFLGTGGSLGIPVVGCHCPVCLSTSPFNKRLRPCNLITIENKKFLLDVGPDFRTQALTHQIDDINGVIVTHAHHDHTAGIDDLRVYHLENDQPIPFLMSRATYQDLLVRFAYIFAPQQPSMSLVSRFCVQLLENESGDTQFEGIPIRYLTFMQTSMPVNGLVIGDLAFLSDIKTYSDTIFSQLKGVRTLIISALRYTPSQLHFSVDDAIDFATRVGAEKVYLTHIAHEVEHEHLASYLPSHIRPAYDGLEITFNT